jgi:O-acetyl-ADP-ribose deacetylase (regulator of RNase III)
MRNTQRGTKIERPMDRTVVKVVHGDITKRQVDAIVNAANSTLLGGGGVDGAIHRAAGVDLLEECKLLGGGVTGEAKVTKAYSIRQAKYIIHTVGPIYGRNKEQEARQLASCYRESLRAAVESGCRSIAFPSISTGAYGYPILEASRIALTSIREFVTESRRSLDLVEIATFSASDQRIYERAYREIFGGASA